MQKVKRYSEIRFAADILNEAATIIKQVALRQKQELRLSRLTVQHDDAEWSYDNVEEFLADYRKYQVNANFSIHGNSYDLTIYVYERYTSVSVTAPTRQFIETVFDVFEKHAAASKLPPIPETKYSIPSPRVFIGHGHSKLWMELKDHLQDKHKIQIEAYETGARAGHTIRDILEDMVQTSTFAVLVLTAEDEQPDGKLRARQNIIHETGLFQGRLGFSRAIILLEEGAEPFSNIAGIQYIAFSKGNIRETFGEVVATIRREFSE